LGNFGVFSATTKHHGFTLGTWWLAAPANMQEMKFTW